MEDADGEEKANNGVLKGAVGGAARLGSDGGSQSCVWMLHQMMSYRVYRVLSALLHKGTYRGW